MTDQTRDERAPDPMPRDEEALERLKRFGGDKLLHEMIRLFLEAAPERIAAAAAAVAASDAAAAELALHSLKSSSAQLGAMRMQRLSEQGEQLAKAGDLVIVGFLVQDLEEEFALVQRWLTSIHEGGLA